jgi:hypothetical protein
LQVGGNLFRVVQRPRRCGARGSSSTAGRYNPPLPPPDFCSKPCDPNIADQQWPSGQACLDEEKQCGFPISDGCNRRVALSRNE